MELLRESKSGSKKNSFLDEPREETLATQAKKSNATNFGNQKCHLRNQTRQVSEIKSAIWLIKSDKFRKSKVSFEKSNDLILKI